MGFVTGNAAPLLIGAATNIESTNDLLDPVFQIVIIGDAGHFAIANHKKRTGWQVIFLAGSLRQIIGFDVMEFAPINGFHTYDFAASMLTYKLMGITARSLKA